MVDRGEMRLPLEGVRVLELGYGIAAPVAARNLAQLGADVIRVESARKPDSLRMGGAGWLPTEFDQTVRRDTIPALNFSSPEKRRPARLVLGPWNGVPGVLGVVDSVTTNPGAPASAPGTNVGAVGLLKNGL